MRLQLGLLRHGLLLGHDMQRTVVLELRDGRNKLRQLRRHEGGQVLRVGRVCLRDGLGVLGRSGLLGRRVHLHADIVFERVLLRIGLRDSDRRLVLRDERLRVCQLRYHG